MSNTVILNEDSPEIQYLCRKDKRLAKLISMVGEIKYTLQNENCYAFLVHEIIEQMLSAKVGNKIYSRLEELCGGVILPEKVSELTDDQIKSIGTSRRKVDYIRHITKSAQQGILEPAKLEKMSDEEIMQVLTSIRGVGKWTAKMYLIFVLDRHDVLPFEDVAFRQVYRWLYNTDDSSPESIRKRCESWSPYSTYASRYFYSALDAGLTKKL